MMPYSDAQSGYDTTYWEKVASTRWGTYITDIEKRAILRGHDLSREPTTALEIGCEGGRWSKLLTDLGWDMICTDINEEVLKICKAKIPTATCILVRPNDNKVPCTSECISLLLCIEVASVIQSEWFINETFRVLKKDGLIVGVFLNIFSVRGLFVHIKNYFANKHEFYRVPYITWRKKLLNRGYHIIYEEGFCWFPFQRDSDSLFVPYFTRLEKKLGLRKLVVLSPWIVFIAQKSSKKCLM